VSYRVFRVRRRKIVALILSKDGLPLLRSPRSGGGGIRTFRVPMDRTMKKERTMKTRRLGIAAALITMPFTGLPAWSAACVTAPVSTYTAAGFSCTVSDVLWSVLSCPRTKPGGTLVAHALLVSDRHVPG
jgi:hypothetical protein